MINFIRRTAENLFSGYFAIVMATGALSIASHLLLMEPISKGLLYFNVVAYILLWFFTIFRLINYFPRMIADLTSHQKGPGFFTLVAGTCMFGSQLIVVANKPNIAFILWIVGILLWSIVMYTFFTAVTVGKNKPTMAEGINGAWLIAAVATQSISVLGTLLSAHISNGRDIILFYTLCMFLLGCMLYLNIITLIFYRFTFLKFRYAALTPPYWINMGAVAIATLAGSNLMLHAKNWPFLVDLLPFLKGFTLFFWITGTWWIPLLFILMVWKHFYHHAPLKYDPNFWGMAFPLAMYTTCTFQLSKALSLPFLMLIPKIMVFIAMGAWVFIFLGLVHHLYLDIKNNGE